MCLPLVVTSQPLRKDGKLQALRFLGDRLYYDFDGASFSCWTHVDDRDDICREISSDRYFEAVHWHMRDRRSLLQLCRDGGVL